MIQHTNLQFVMKCIWIFSLSLLLYSCQQRGKDTSSLKGDSAVWGKNNFIVKGPPVDGPKLICVFQDSLQVGNKGNNLVDLKNYHLSDSAYVVIDFYRRVKNGSWELIQTFDTIKEPHTDCDAQVQDFNNDGFNDLSYVSDVAGRGSNEGRTIFIYDRRSDTFTRIINSPDYPNLSYNKEVDCLESMRFHRECTSVFLKLEGNKLREFITATVVTGDDEETLYYEVSFVDRNGDKKLVERLKVAPEYMFNGYDNYELIRKYAKY